MADIIPPKTIKAVHQPDPASPALVLTTTPIPVPAGPHEHLIKVKATAPCRHELTWELAFPHIVPAARERVPCTEAAGIVVASPHTAFRPGDRVFFRMLPRRAACLREYTIAMTHELARMPATLGWEHAAATPLSALTAYQGLFTHGVLDGAALRGDQRARASNGTVRVLVTGAGGSVGSWAVQLAAAAGAAAVVAVCAPGKGDDVVRAGATETVDYTRRTLGEWVGEDEARMCDMALDCVGGSLLAGCWSAVRDGGVILSVADAPDERRPGAVAGGKRMTKAAWFLMEPSGKDLAEISRVIEEGKAVPWIDSVYEFEQFAEAFERVDSGKAKGKVVIKVDC